MAADPIDERYDEIVRGLRAAPGAPVELRGRVLELAAAADKPRRSRRRGLTIAVALGLLVLGGVAGILLESSGPGSRKASQGARAEAARPAQTDTAPGFAPETKQNPNLGSALSGGAHGSIALPVNLARLTEVRASMRLRVSSLCSCRIRSSSAFDWSWRSWIETCCARIVPSAEKRTTACCTCPTGTRTVRYASPFPRLAFP